MINVNVPINSVSFGFVAANILVELFKRKIDIRLFPIGGQVDLSSYSVAARLPGFENYLKESIYYALEKFDRNDPTLKLWHIRDSEQSYGVRRNLLTFHELSELTPNEVNILRNQDTIYLTSKYSQEVFKKYNIDSIYCPLAFDSLHFNRIEKRAYKDDRIVWGLVGKLEPSRKGHAKVIQNWIKKYGNNHKHVLHLHVNNPFLNKEQNEGLLNQIWNGQKPFNINVLPQVQTLTTLNQCYNSIDIILDGSRAEGFSLPSFHCLALGKHGVIHNATAMKDWLPKSGAVTFESSNLIEPYDNMFFPKGVPWNQGLIWDWDDNEFLSAMETAERKFLYNPLNETGLQLQQEYTWQKTVDILLKNLK